MKKLIFALLIFAISQNSYAQSRKKIKFDASFGIGILSTFFKDESKTITPPLNLKLDYRLKPNFSIGLSVGYSANEVQRDVMKDNNFNEWVNRYTVIQLRGTVHTDYLARWRIYGGMWLGYNHSSIKLINGNWEKIMKHTKIRPSSGELNISAFVGGRFALSKKIGLYSELGLGISLVTIGGSYLF